MAARAERRLGVCFLSCILPPDDTRVARVSESVASMGYQVSYIMCQPKSSWNPNSSPARLLPRVEYFFEYGTSLTGLLAAIACRMRNSVLAFRHALAMRPNVIHCYEPDSWLIAVLLKMLIGSKVVVEVLETYDSRSLAFPPILRPVVRAMIRFLMRMLSLKTDGLIHVSDNRRKLYSYLRPCVTEVIHYYPDLRAFPRQAVRRKRAGSFIVLHAGPLRRSYASLELLAAIRIASRVVPGLRCIALGGVEGNLPDLKESVRDLCAEGLLLLLPHVPFSDVVKYMQEADVGVSLVLPVDEGHTLAFPRKLFEYLAAGLPVIASDSDDIRRTLVGWDCGLIVSDSSSPQEIAECIVRVATDEPLRERMGRNARLASEREFNWDKEVRKLRNLYASVMRRGSDDSGPQLLGRGIEGSLTMDRHSENI